MAVFKFAFWSKTVEIKILADLNLVAQYGIVISVCMHVRMFQVKLILADFSLAVVSANCQI